MPNRGDKSDLLQAVLCLAASRGVTLPAKALREKIGDQLDLLISLGAAHYGRPLSRIVCRSCYDGHTSLVEYDVASRRSWIMCPEAGRVIIEDHTLETVQISLSWLRDRLAEALRVNPSPPRRTLMEGVAWWLGDVDVGSTPVSIALGIGIRNANEVHQLIDRLQQHPPPGLGFLLIAGDPVPGYTSELTRYQLIPIKDLAYADGATICIDRARLEAWTRGLLQGKIRPAAGQGGRPSRRDRILTLFNERRQQGERYVSKLGEARAMRKEWSARFLNEVAPSASGIRSHLPKPQ